MDTNVDTNVRKRTLKPYHGIILFALVVVFELFGAAPIQARLGMAGVAVTELIILAMAIIPALLLKVNLKEMFPVKKPALRQVFGVLLIWFGTFLLGILITMFIGFFFPQGMAQLGTDMGNIFRSVPMWATYLIVAVMPAICEESLHRGFILTSMKPIRKDWIIVVVMGVIFGIFHLDPYRFAATAILGMGITYVMLKTQNFLMPALFHLVNNSLSVIASFLSAGAAGAAQQADTAAVLSSGMSLGSYLIIGSIIPFLLLGGVVLLREKIDPAAQSASEPAAPTPAAAQADAATACAAPTASTATQVDAQTAAAKRKKSTLRALIISAVLFAVMLIAGAGIIAVSVLANPVLDHTETVSINEDTQPLVLTFDVTVPRAYLLTYDLSTERGLIEMTIKDASGKEINSFSAAKINGSEPVTLETGRYTVTFTFIQKDIESYYKEKNIEYNPKDLAALDVGGDLTIDKSADIMISIK